MLFRTEDLLPPDAERVSPEPPVELSPEELERLVAFNSELAELAERGDTEGLTRHYEGRGTFKVIESYLAKALKAAVVSFDIPTLQLFISFGLDLGDSCFKGLLPTLAATEYQSEATFLAVLKLLLEAGLSIHDTESEEYCTALHVACTRPNSLFLVTTLLQHQADPNAINRRGLMPLNIASTPEVEEVLRLHGAVANWRDDLPSHS